MIVVRVELHSAITGQRTELARMEICNQGSGSVSLGDYAARTLRGRGEASLNQGALSRSTTLDRWPRQKLHVWNLVAALLSGMGYGHPARKGQLA